MSAKKNNGNVLVNVVVILIVLAAAGFFTFRSLQSTARVKAVGRDNAVDAVTGTVNVFAVGGYKEVKSESGGKVVSAKAIDRGSPFKSGAALVQLDTTDIDREIAELDRNFENAKEGYALEQKDNPAEQLAEERLATATRLREVGNVADEDVKAAQRALDEVRKQITLRQFQWKKGEADYKVNRETLLLRKQKMTIPAPPIDGIVHVPHTWEGALIGPGQTVAVVFSNDRVVSAKISEEKFGKVRVGQMARVRLLTLGEDDFDAVVSKLLPTADEAQRFEVELEVKADPALLKPGSTGEVTITVESRKDQVMIPRRALISNESVFVVHNGRVSRRPVKVGFLSMTVAEIREGLKVGEFVIVDNLDEFRDGQRVKVEVVIW